MANRTNPLDPNTTPLQRRWFRHGRYERDESGSRKNTAAGDEQERLITEALQDLRSREVREVMTPRVDVTYLSIPVHEDDIIKAVRSSGHSAFPVVHDDLDDLVGILFVNDLFRSRGQSRDLGQLQTRDESSATKRSSSAVEISRRVRQPFVIPESRRVLDALFEMRKHRRGYAIVVDEYGGVAGVLTVKDLLEPIVGELHDEFDPASDEPSVVRVDALRWLLDGRTSIDEVGSQLGFVIPDGEYVTLAGYLLDAMGVIPKEGDSFEAFGWEFKVVEMEKRRIVKIVARKLGETKGPESTPNSPGGRRISTNGSPVGSP